MLLNVYSIPKYQGFSCDLVLLALGHFVSGTRNMALLGIWEGLGRNRNPGEPLNAHVVKKEDKKNLELQIQSRSKKSDFSNHCY